MELSRDNTVCTEFLVDAENFSGYQQVVRESETDGTTTVLKTISHTFGTGLMKWVLLTSCVVRVVSAGGFVNAERIGWLAVGCADVVRNRLQRWQRVGFKVLRGHVWTWFDHPHRGRRGDASPGG